MAGGFGVGGMGVSNPFSGRKYDLVAQEQQNQRELMQSQEKQINTQTNLAPGQAASEEAQRYGEANQAAGLGALSRARAENTTETTPSQIQGNIAGAENQQSQGNLNQAQQGPASQWLIDFINSQKNSTSLNKHMGDANVGYADGGMVPGQGTGHVDTVPAMLAPGEAVLNRGAADHVGRDVIGLLNAIGARKMGMSTSPAEAQTDTTDNRAMGANGNAGANGKSAQHYAEGAEVVGGGTGISGVAGQEGSWSGPLPGKPPPTPEQAAVQPVDPQAGTNAAFAMRAKLQNHAKGTSNVQPQMGGKPPMGGKGAAPKGKGGFPGKGEKASPGGKSFDPTSMGVKNPGQGNPSPHGDHPGLSPELISALMAMHGHGMPPRQPQAMPMSMPMVGQTPPQMGGGATMLPRQGGGQ